LQARYQALLGSVTLELTRSLNSEAVARHHKDLGSLSNQQLNDKLLQYLGTPDLVKSKHNEFAAFMIEVEKRVDPEGQFTVYLGLPDQE